MLKKVGRLMDKVMIYTDRHKRDTDFQTIQGYVKAQLATDKSLEDLVTKNNITTLISGGDLYDKGYLNLGAMYDDTRADRKLTSLVNGEHYICPGNHLFLQRDTNPELYLIQPCDKYKPIHRCRATEPVIKVVDTLIKGCVQFSFFHFDKDNKLYIAERQPGIKYHVGIYHDDTVVPNSARRKSGLMSDIDSMYLKTIFKNIDIAIVNHIHVQCGHLHLNVDGREVLVILPGACCVTSSRASEFHKTVALPTFECYEDRMVYSENILDIHSDMLNFKSKQKKTVPKEMQANLPVDIQMTVEEFEEKMVSSSNVMDILSGKLEIDLYKNAVKGVLDTAKCIQLVADEYNRTTTRTKEDS